MQSPLEVSRALAAQRSRGDIPISRGGHPAPIADIITAQQEGAAAVYQSVTPGQSPYLADRSPRGRFLALMWFRGYRDEQHRITLEQQSDSNA